LRRPFASDGGEPDDEQRAGYGEESDAQEELPRREGRKRVASGGRCGGGQGETSAGMSRRQTPNRDLRKISIRKSAAAGKGVVRVDPVRADRPLQFPYAWTGLPALIAYRLRAQERRVEFQRRRRAMADIVYVVVGLLFFALMGVYAVACDRL
jgi:hypothetical protein